MVPRFVPFHETEDLPIEPEIGRRLREAHGPRNRGPKRCKGDRISDSYPVWNGFDKGRGPFRDGMRPFVTISCEKGSTFEGEQVVASAGKNMAMSKVFSSVRSAVLAHVKLQAMPAFSYVSSRGFAAEAGGSFLDKAQVTERVLGVVKNFQKVDPNKVRLGKREVLVKEEQWGIESCGKTSVKKRAARIDREGWNRCACPNPGSNACIHGSGE